MMKKIFLSLVSSLIPFTSAFLATNIIKNNDISGGTINKLKDLDAGLVKNGANVSSFGFSDLASRFRRRARLEITMTGDMYAYFLEGLKNGPKEHFIMIFTGYEEPFMKTEQGKKVQSEIKTGCETASEKRSLPKNGFFKLFTDGLKTDTGWDSFRNVFTGENLKNNTYVMPSGYNQAQAQEDYRRNGVLLQFEFNYYNLDATMGKMDNICRIFPYTQATAALTSYYQDTEMKSEEGVIKETKVPPLMPIKTDKPKDTVRQLLGDINDAIKSGFNILGGYLDQKIIKIDSNQYDEKVSTDSKNPTILKLIFCNYKGIEYTDKTIKIFRPY